MTPDQREAEQQWLIAKALANTHWAIPVGRNKTRDTLAAIKRYTAADLEEREWKLLSAELWRAVGR
jgi:hypothetical protein